MSVEDYLNSIRKNTNSNSQKTDKLNSTIKDLLNYEALKRAVEDGVEDANKEQFKKLSELSKKILMSSDATAGELQEINQLLKLFYAQIPKNNSGNAQVPAQSWIQALKEVLDEFGDALPDKFQKRLKYDIVNTASQGGANPREVFQQLNQQQNIQINQSVTLNNIYVLMKNQNLLVERKAEAEKPIKDQKEKENKNFWQTVMGKVTGSLSALVGNLSKAAKWLGLLYVGLGVWHQLRDDVKKLLQGGAGLVTGGIALSGLGRLAASSKAFAPLLKMLKPLLAVFKPIGALLKGFSKLAGPISKFAGPVGLAITAISSIYDFMEGFNNTKGSTMDKIVGGLENAIVKFVSSIWDLLKQLPKYLNIAFQATMKLFGKLIVKLANKLTETFKVFEGKGLKEIVTIIGKSIANFGKGLFDGILSGVAAMVESALKESDMPDWLKNALVKFYDKLPVKAKSSSASATTMAELDLSKIFGSSDNSKSRTEANLDAALPFTPSGYGTQSVATKINRAPGVVLSPQSSDFIQRAGLTDLITSGTRKPVNARDWTGKKVGAGSISARSHASGNKFDIGAYGKNVSQLVSTLEKLAKTPGLVEAHVEGAGQKWRQIYLFAIEDMVRRGILKHAGYEGKEREPIYSTPSGGIIGWWGSQYSSAQHIDVLVDPKQSGKPALANTDQTSMSTSITNASNVGTGKNTNPLVAQMTEQLTKVFNEQSKLFEQGAKSPDQLASTQNKAATSAIVSQIGNAQTGNGVTFNKQNDINSASLMALELVGMTIA